MSYLFGALVVIASFLGYRFVATNKRPPQLAKVVDAVPVNLSFVDEATHQIVEAKDFVVGMQGKIVASSEHEGFVLLFVPNSGGSPSPYTDVMRIVPGAKTAFTSRGEAISFKIESEASGGGIGPQTRFCALMTKTERRLADFRNQSFGWNDLPLQTCIDIVAKT